MDENNENYKIYHPFATLSSSFSSNLESLLMLISLSFARLCSSSYGGVGEGLQEMGGFGV